MNIETSRVLEKIDELISKKGFVYSMIMAQIEDQTIPASNLDKRNNHERLSSNEILFLWSLLVNKENFWQYPDTIDDLYSMRREIGRLMTELHFTFFSGVISHMNNTKGLKFDDYKPYYDGAVFQEAIFYSGGGLYDEEYLYYIRKRFAEDSQWLKDNKGYDKDAFCDIVSKIKLTLATKIRRFRFLSLPETLEQRLANKPSEIPVDDFIMSLTLSQFLYNQNDEPTLQEFCDRLKDAICFTKEDLDKLRGVDDYLCSFSITPSKDCNETCREPGDYSILMSSPIIKTSEGCYLLTEIHQLFKSLYDVPRYWLNDQLNEHKKIGSHTGCFSERQTLTVLRSIFGNNCYKDINVLKGKNRITDIDALCIWKDYAICFQIKSKGLTLSSRQGNIDAIRSDFQKSFQAAYKQGVKCRDALLNPIGYRFEDNETGKKIVIPTLREVYIVCESSDEYPSLTQQMAILLHRKDSEPAALAINLFDIDVMGKYLNEPYYFVHYIHNRLKFYSNTRTDVETNCLYAYTYNRLFLTGSSYDDFMFGNSFAKAIDAELLPKYEKNESITVDNSKWRDTTYDALIKEIESSSNDGVGEIVLNMLNFGRDEVKQIGIRINELLQRGLNGKQEYYSFRNGEFGFSFIVMKLEEKSIIHEFMKAVSLKEIKKHKLRNWLTIVHFQGTNSLVGTIAYISGKRGR